jgi:hypothetical protein
MLEGIKKSVIARDGFFPPAQATNPQEVAKLIQAVLEKTSTQHYSQTDWDYRITEHHLLAQNPIKQVTPRKSAL